MSDIEYFRRVRNEVLSVKNCKLFDPPKAESSYNLAKHFMKPENSRRANKIELFTKPSIFVSKLLRPWAESIVGFSLIGYSNFAPDNLGKPHQA